MDRYIQETDMLDYSNANIQKLIQARAWQKLDTFGCIKAVYNFVRDEILFGYNIDDAIPASKVLADGYGQCNTKEPYLWHCLEPAISLAEYMALRLIKNCKRER